MLFKIAVVVLLFIIAAWAWVTAAMLRYIGGQIDRIADEVREHNNRLTIHG